MLDILELMFILQTLKITARTGWNKLPEPGETFAPRTVPEAESVADHSWAVAMFALLIGHRLGLNAEKMAAMAALHDVAECITSDIVTATLGPEEAARVEAEKKACERAAMERLFPPLGEVGTWCLTLWNEYEEGTTEEARVLREIDKLECGMQAVIYGEAGHQLSQREFLAHARGKMRHPKLLELLDVLDRRATH